MTGTARRLRRGTVVLAVLAAVGVLPAVAYAQFRDAGAAAMDVSTATLAAPTGVTATCSTSKATTTATVGWTASSRATGYQVMVSANGGAYSLFGTSTTTSLSGSVAKNNSYTFTVHATLAGWTSAASAPSASIKC